MKITVLAENTAVSEEYSSEHGLSLYIETEKHKILFDMGQTDIFEQNAKKLGIDLSEVDIAVLSHGHYDHGGGLLRFLEINPNALVYVNSNAFGEYYSGKEKYIGLDRQIKSNERVVCISSPLNIDNELTLLPFDYAHKIEDLGSFGLYKKEENVLVPDDFSHEHYLVITENGRRTVISGCSHNGIMNITDFLRPDALVGGFHLSKVSAENEESRILLSRCAEHLLSYPTLFYTCHCTGDTQYLYMKEIMKEKLLYIRTGTVIEI